MADSISSLESWIGEGRGGRGGGGEDWVGGARSATRGNRVKQQYRGYGIVNYHSDSFPQGFGDSIKTHSMTDWQFKSELQTRLPVKRNDITERLKGQHK